MKSKKLTLEEWIGTVGKQQATAKLIMGGLKPSTADKIARGKYRSQLVRDASIDAIKQAMAFDGYTFIGGNHKAS